VASVALIRLALVSVLVFSALRFVPPGRSSILVYTSSLWTAPLAAWFLRERLTRWRIAGMVAGAVGVTILVEPWTLDWSNGRTALGYGMLLLAAIATSVGTVHIRGHRWTATEFELMPWQLALAGVVTGILALALEGPPEVTWTMATAGNVAYQAVLASAFGIWGFLTMSRSLPAISTNLTLMAVPAIGLASSVLFVGEPLTVQVVAGLLLILAGAGAGVSTPSD
jgi:drug/metabolite transporter (DMT)-like permease